MSDSVCCPNCWTWSPLDKRTTCKRCGVSLVLSDGRTIEAALSLPPPPPPPPPGFANGAVLSMAGGGMGPVAYSATRIRDWVAVCRWLTLGYGGVVGVVLLVIGLLVRHVEVPVLDPTTRLVVSRSIDLGPSMAFAAIVVFAFFALFAWLTRFPLARGIFAMFTVLALYNSAGSLGLYAHDMALELGTLVALGFNLAYGWALLMSFLRPVPQS